MHTSFPTVTHTRESPMPASQSCNIKQCIWKQMQIQNNLTLKKGLSNAEEVFPSMVSQVDRINKIVSMASSYWYQGFYIMMLCLYKTKYTYPINGNPLQDTQFLQYQYHCPFLTVPISSIGGLTGGTFKSNVHGPTLETHDLWDIWYWWGDMTWSRFWFVWNF